MRARPRPAPLVLGAAVLAPALACAPAVSATPAPETPPLAPAAPDAPEPGPEAPGPGAGGPGGLGDAVDAVDAGASGPLAATGARAGATVVVGALLIALGAGLVARRRAAP